MADFSSSFFFLSFGRTSTTVPTKHRWYFDNENMVTINTRKQVVCIVWQDELNVYDRLHSIKAWCQSVILCLVKINCHVNRTVSRNDKLIFSSDVDSNAQFCSSHYSTRISLFDVILISKQLPEIYLTTGLMCANYTSCFLSHCGWTAIHFYRATLC